MLTKLTHSFIAPKSMSSEKKNKKYKDFHPVNEFPNRKRRLQTQETVSFRGESYELGFLTKALK